MQTEAQTEILKKFNYVSTRESSDCPAFNCPEDKAFEFLKSLRDDFGYEKLSDVTAIDWDKRTPRFTVVWHLYHLETNQYVRVASDLISDEKPVCSSVVELWDAANWHERETYDMFGIIFENHPDLRRILMWDGYPYYPLRKEFPLAGKEIELPAEDVRQRVDTKVKPAPMVGGPFRAEPGSPMSDMEPVARDESWSEQNEKKED